MTIGDQMLFDPSWGDYDMAVGSTVTSVFGGPADRAQYGETDDFRAATVPLRSFPQEEQKRHAYYQKLRDTRQKPEAGGRAQVVQLINEFFAQPRQDWLQAMELLELSHQYLLQDSDRERLLSFLEPANFQRDNERQCVRDGLTLANRSL